MIQASRIITKAAVLLQDTGAVRWSASELLDWLNMGQVQIVTVKPDAVSIVAEMRLVAGKTRQSLPNGTASFPDASGATLRSGIKLLDIVRNMGSDGKSPGRAIQIVDRKFLDQVDPFWHSGGPSTTIYNYTYDEKTPRIFYVTPPVHATVNVWVELVYTPVPTPLTSSDDYIELSDEYEPILLDYVLFRALSKQIDSADALQKAVAYYQAFMGALERYGVTEIEADPNIHPISSSFRRTQ